ncbi:hypothetical protein FH5_00563 [Priestia endophytica]|nr:hypothetical protein FH5_00563 [Priestia endophytica]
MFYVQREEQVYKKKKLFVKSFFLNKIKYSYANQNNAKQA